MQVFTIIVVLGDFPDAMDFSIFTTLNKEHAKEYLRFCILRQALQPGASLVGVKDALKQQGEVYNLSIEDTMRFHMRTQTLSTMMPVDFDAEEMTYLEQDWKELRGRLE